MARVRANAIRPYGWRFFWTENIFLKNNTPPNAANERISSAHAAKKIACQIWKTNVLKKAKSDFFAVAARCVTQRTNAHFKPFLKHKSTNILKEKKEKILKIERKYWGRHFLGFPIFFVNILNFVVFEVKNSPPPVSLRQKWFKSIFRWKKVFLFGNFFGFEAFFDWVEIILLSVYR